MQQDILCYSETDAVQVQQLQARYTTYQYKLLHTCMMNTGRESRRAMPFLPLLTLLVFMVQ